MTFPENLLKLRTERGLTQADVAKAIDIRTLTYQRYEYGEREPRLSKLIALADFFDVSLDYLIGRSETRERQP